MKKTITGFAGALAALALTTAYAAWDPAEIDDRHAKAEEAKAVDARERPGHERVSSITRQDG